MDRTTQPITSSATAPPHSMDELPPIIYSMWMTGSGSDDPPALSLLRDAALYREALARYFRSRSRDPAEVEDLVQEVFMRVAARDADLSIGNLAAYLFQTAASVLADRHRRATVRQANSHVEFDADRHSDHDFDAARILEGRETLNAVVDALLTLPERTRTIFILRRLEGYAYKEIAALLGISVSAVEKHMVRAVQHLMSSPGCM